MPGMTQDPVPAGGSFTYEFTAPDPARTSSTCTSASNSTVACTPPDVDDPNEPGAYDAECGWSCWTTKVDGTGRTPGRRPREVDRRRGPRSPAQAAWWDGGHGPRRSRWRQRSATVGRRRRRHLPLLPDQRTRPHRSATFEAKPGQRVRIRLINAASDTTAGRVGGHRLTVTHSDGGFPVEPRRSTPLYLGMGERYDAPLHPRRRRVLGAARPFGKTEGGQGLALVRTGSLGRAPGPDVSPAELAGRILLASHRPASPRVGEAGRPHDRRTPPRICRWRGR